MNELTTHQRLEMIYKHQEPDRVPIIDVPWGTTIQRWQREGMPEGADFIDYLGLDKICKFDVDNSPRFPVKVLSGDEKFIIRTNEWGATIKEQRDATSSIEFLDYSVTDRALWEAAKARMDASDDRIPWQRLKENYKKWKDEAYWIRGRMNFGFQQTSLTMGLTECLIAMLEEPELIIDQMNTQLDIAIALLDKAWDAGYTFDELSWDDDLGYKNAQFFSVEMYRELVKPIHKRAIDWAHAHGAVTHMHTCGDVRPFMPEFIDIGLDAVNALEVKAGMDPVMLKNKYGKDIVLRGGFDPQFWTNHEYTAKNIEEVLPIMKQRGGYIFSSDHSIPDTVSLADYQFVLENVRKLGTY